MPTLITRGVSSAYAFGLTTASIGRYGWVAMLTSTSATGVVPYATRVTSTGSYVIGLNNGSDYGQEYILTLDSTGTTLSSKTVFEDTGNNAANTVYDIALDASDNVYSIGRKYQIWYPCCQTCVNYYYWTGVSKTNSSSSNLGSTYFGLGNFNAPYFTDISKYSDGSMLISGFTFNTNAWPTMVKLNASLTTVSWSLQNGDNVYIQLRTTVDSTDSAIGFRYNSSGSQINIIKANSTGTITYKKWLNGLGAYYVANGSGPYSKPTVDSSNNIYFTGNYSYPTTVCCCVTYTSRSMAISVDSTATTVRFAKGYVSSGGYIYLPTSPVKDSSDNMYFANYYQGSLGVGMVIFKINSSGILQWARTLTGLGNAVVTTGTTQLAIDGANYVMSMYGGSGKGWVLKMPIDGSGSGTSFSIGGFSCSYGTPTDFSVVDLTGLSLASESGTTYSNISPSLVTTGIAPAASTVFTVTNKKI